MEVILKEDVAKLGSRGDVVKVAEGYGRNYLLPRKLAIQADEGNKAVIVQMKAASVRRSAKEKTQAEELAKQFDGVSVAFQRRTGEHDQLFGSVTSSDIGDALTKKGFNIDRRKIQLHEPLKTVGEFTAGSGWLCQCGSSVQAGMAIRKRRPSRNISSAMDGMNFRTTQATGQKKS
jgi:large subunit ribosomal protein L9